MTRIIGVVSGKGGVGKTTVALNLGTVLAKHFNKDVTLVDCNITTSHIGIYLGMYNHNVDLNKVLREEHSVEEAIHSHHSGLKIVPASISVDDLHGVDITKLNDVLRRLEYHTDMIILDAAPGLGREASAAMRNSSEVLYVTNPFIPSVMDLIKCQQIADEVGTHTIGTVLNMSTGDSHELTKKEVEHLTNTRVVSTIPMDKHVRRSVAVKRPVVLYKPHSKASREIVKLAANIVNEELPRRSMRSRLQFW